VVQDQGTTAAFEVAAIAAGDAKAACAAIGGMCREDALRALWGELEFEDRRLDGGEDDGVEVVEALPFDAFDELPFLVSPVTGASVEPRPRQGDVAAASADPGTGDDAEPDDAFAVFTRILEDVLLAEGGTPQAALLLRALLGESRLEGRSAPPAAEEALVTGKLATTGMRGLTRTPELGAQVVAWQSLLRGETEEVGASVTQTLDEWAANLVSRAMGAPNRMPALKRELRGRGIAAFGLVADAA
jgi:hypothetical protein